MAFPAYLHIGSIRVHPHLIFEAFAYGFAFRLYLALRKSRGDYLEDLLRWWLIAAATSGALFGAIFLAWLENPERLLAHGGGLQSFASGKTIVGALIGGLAAVEYAKRRFGITRHTGDLFTIPLCAGIAIGRIGCFLTGLEDGTCGSPSSLPWAVNFGDGVPRHPAQIYEIVFLIFLAAVIFGMSRRPYMEGDLFKLFMVSYFSFRLIVDFLKPGLRVFLGLTSIQIACVVMLGYYAGDVRRLLRSLFLDRFASAPGSTLPIHE